MEFAGEEGPPPHPANQTRLPVKIAIKNKRTVLSFTLSAPA